MKKEINTVRSIPAFLAVLLLLLVSSSHIHFRYCLDGDEAPVSIHFEPYDLHSSEIDLVGGLAGADKSDIESELSLDAVRDKNATVSIEAIASFTSYSALVVSWSPISYLLYPPDTLPNKPATLLSLTRAPPALA
ncbi:MAG: hypothetical protein R3332_10175 [Pseudohongiellaceae bacterium]|nr:hypothetical protein [Pseudohongiellaceae bacterium]